VFDLRRGTPVDAALVATGAGPDGRAGITKVSPVLVLEVAADPALYAAGYRHLVRYIRLRAAMAPIDVRGALTVPDERRAMVALAGSRARSPGRPATWSNSRPAR